VVVKQKVWMNVSVCILYSDIEIAHKLVALQSVIRWLVGTDNEKIKIYQLHDGSAFSFRKTIDLFLCQTEHLH
jgi:hypothetical protein